MSEICFIREVVTAIGLIGIFLAPPFLIGIMLDKNLKYRRVWDVAGIAFLGLSLILWILAGIGFLLRWLAT